MTCPETLTHAAVQACVTLNGVIDSLFDDDDPVSIDNIAEIRSELCSAYAGLCAVLSREFKVNAHAEIQKYMSAEIDTMRAMIKARGGL